jgi:hypothetical protein
MIGTRLVPVGPGKLVPVILFAKLFGNDDLWHILKYTESGSMVLVTRYTQPSPNRLKVSGLVQ